MESVTSESVKVGGEDELNSETHDHSYAVRMETIAIESVIIDDHSYATSAEFITDTSSVPNAITPHSNEIEISKSTLQSNEVISDAKITQNSDKTSLGIIASNYNSDFENDANDIIDEGSVEIETEICDNFCVNEIVNQSDYRSNNEITCVSDSSSDDDSGSSDSESDSSDSSVVATSGSDSENEGNSKKTNVRKVVKQPKGEFDDLPPIEDLQISVPEVLCDPLGQVAWTVEQMVVVRPIEGKPTLNLDTVLFIEKGSRALGRIFDVFGQVTDPHYCVRFNSSDHIKESDIKVGMTVYYCPNSEHTSLVFLSEMTKMKPCDGVGDGEHPEFSDDEEEQKYYAQLRNKQRTNGTPELRQAEQNAEVPKKRKRNNQKPGWRSNHPWNSNREYQSYPRQNNYPQSHNNSYQQPPAYNQSNWYQQNYTYPNYWQQSYNVLPMQRMNPARFGVPSMQYPPMMPWNAYPPPSPGAPYQHHVPHQAFQAPPPPPPPPPGM